MRVPIYSGIAVLISCGLAQAETQHWAATSTASIAITGDIVTHDDRITFAGGAELGLQPVGSDRQGVYRIDPPANPELENGNRLCGDNAPTFIALAPDAGSASLAESSSLHLIVFQGTAVPPASASTSGMAGGGPGRCAVLNYERKPSQSSESAEALPDRDAIRRAQELLNGLGYDAGGADGVMGSRTRQALISFQGDHGLETTGEPDRQTMAALVGGADGAGPSFDCLKAGTATERAICASPVLSRLDMELAASFQARQDRLAGPAADLELQRQRDWLAARNRCDGDVPCLEKSYRERLTTIDASEKEEAIVTTEPVSPNRASSPVTP